LQFANPVRCQIITVPTSSAASGNQLGLEKVEKLVFIYINNCLLDPVDSIDYIADDENEEED